MSSMKLAGFISGTLIALIAVSVLLAGALGFGGWAFMSRQDYKNNSDQKAAAAADERQMATEAADAIKYAEEAKNPLTIHKGLDEFGGVDVKYPKTWSGYVIEGAKGATPVDNYFHPKVVPNVSNRESSYALRIQVVDKEYDLVLREYKNDTEAGRLSAGPYKLPQVKGAVGTRFSGEVEDGKQGSLVVLPVRNMTLKVWTESPNYLADFNNIILPNLVFSP